MSSQALAIALCLQLVGFPTAESEDPVHGKEYWDAIAEDGYRVPDDEDPYELLVDLYRNLGSVDSTLRDDYGYGITVEWIYRQELLSDEQNVALVERLLDNLKVEIGEQGTDSVLLRSFSALNLSLFAAIDLKSPFLDQAQFEALLSGTLEYLANERDLRGRDDTRGWIHSAAHTADALKFLVRNPRLTPEGQDRILQGVANKLAHAGIVFTYGEDERLSQVVIAAIARSDWDIERLYDLIDTLNEAKRLTRGATAFDEPKYCARQNGVHLLRTLFVLLSQGDNEQESVVEARALLLKTLRTF